MDISHFLEEDIGTGDITTDILLGEEIATGILIAKEPCTVAGLEEAAMVFDNFGLEVKPQVRDGADVMEGSPVLKVRGRAHAILRAERTALNILMRMSGIATKTKGLISRCRLVNPNLIIACTRKTTPGFRYFEKKAVTLGGGDTHRYGLDDAVLIKDNHLKVVGDLERAISRAKEAVDDIRNRETGAPDFARRSFAHRKIEVEVEDIEGALAAARAGAEIIMLDNFEAEDAYDAYRSIKEIDDTILVEVSGGITYDNIEDYARAADVISMGTLTHSYRSIDFSLEMDFDTTVDEATPTESDDGYL